MASVTTQLRGLAAPNGCGLFSCSFCYPDEDSLDAEIGPEIEAEMDRTRVRDAILEANSREMNDCR
jgi:hypothetical protein